MTPSIETIERPVVAVLGAVKQADAEALHSSPVDAARQPLQSSSSPPTDDTFGLPSLEKALDQLEFFSPCLGGDLRRRHLLPFHSLIQPRNKQVVAAAGHQVACAWKENVRHRVADGSQTELVNRALLPEQIDNVQNAAALPFGLLNPAQGP